MLVHDSVSSDTFLKNLEGLFEKRERHPALSSLQVKAWEHFTTLGLPTKKQEAFQYFPLRSFYEEVFSPAEKQDPENIPYHHECKGSTFVFVDGDYRPELSDSSALPKSVVALSLDEALIPYGAFLQTRLRKEFNEEKDPFVFCNLALHARGLFLYVPPKIAIVQKIHFLHIVTKQKDPTAFFPRIFLSLGAFSEVEVVHTVHSDQEKCWINFACDISLEEGSKLQYGDLPLVPSQSWYTSFISATIKRDSDFKMVYFTEGSKSVRQNAHVRIVGENAHANVQGLSILDNKQQSHTHVLMEHAAPHSTSMQLIKTVANGLSQSSFEGKIIVRDVAQKTQAYQLNNNLLLGDHAICQSKPNLEIFADDVKASHGATIAQIDEEELFYLKARGIGASDAKKLLIRGFCREVLDELPEGFCSYGR